MDYIVYDVIGMVTIHGKLALTEDPTTFATRAFYATFYRADVNKAGHSTILVSMFYEGKQPTNGNKYDN